jgi:hypothetical protein
MTLRWGTIHTAALIGKENAMKKNVGGIDSIMRTVLGVIAALAGFFVSMGGGLRIVVFVVAIVLLFTGIYGFCPIWAALGINTRKEKNA